MEHQYIAGQWVRGEGAVFETHDPARDGAVVGAYAEATPVQVDAAVAMAREAFEAWAVLEPAQRWARLEPLVERVQGPLGERLALAITREMGKPLREARAEVRALGAKLGAARASLERLPDLALEGAPGRAAWLPHGVVAVVGPFNYPAHLLNTHVLPALLAGNCVIAKPSEITAGAGVLYGELLAGLDLPPGVFGLLTGRGRTAAALVAHRGVDAVAFTGSWATGRRILEACIEMPSKLLALEMGGRNIAVVLDDAHLDQAVHEVVLGCVLTTGQRCTATSRVLVHRAVAPAFVERLARAFEALEPGDPMDEATLFGPLATKASLARYAAFLDGVERCDEVDTLVPVRTLPGGAWVRPSLHRVGRAPAGSAAATYLDTELFGPDVAVQVVEDDDEAIAWCRRSVYRFSLAVFTAKRARFENFVRRCAWGLYNWNRSTNNASGLLPFGGLGRSGNHRPAGSASGLYCARSAAVLEQPWGTWTPSPLLPPDVHALLRAGSDETS